VIIEDPTTPQTRRYTTLRNIVGFRPSELQNTFYISEVKAAGVTVFRDDVTVSLVIIVFQLWQ